MAIDTNEKLLSMLNFGDGTTLHVLWEADAAVNADDWQHLLDLYSGIAASGVIYRFTTGIFKYVAANYSPLGSLYFEVVHRAKTGTVYARLAAWEAPYDPLTLVAVSGSELSTTSVTDVRQRTAPITLEDGKEYRAQFGKAGSDAGVAEGAEVIAI